VLEKNGARRRLRLSRKIEKDREGRDRERKEGERRDHLHPSRHLRQSLAAADDHCR